MSKNAHPNMSLIIVVDWIKTIGIVMKIQAATNELFLSNDNFRAIRYKVNVLTRVKGISPIFTNFSPPNRKSE